MLTLIKPSFLSSFPPLRNIANIFFLSLVGLDETLFCYGYLCWNMYENKVLDEDRASLNPVGGDTNHVPYSQQHQQQRQQQRALLAMAGVPPGVRMLPPRREARGLPRVLDDQLHPIDRDTPGNSSSNDPNVSCFIM